MIYVEIPKLKKTKEELSNHLEWWLYTLQNLNQLQSIPKQFQGDVIEKAFDKAEFINLPKGEQDKYHKNLKVYRDLLNSIDTAHAEGKVEGEKAKAIEIARKLLKSNMDIEFISATTELTIEEIETLKS